MARAPALADRDAPNDTALRLHVQWLSDIEGMMAVRANAFARRWSSSRASRAAGDTTTAR